MKRIKNKAIVFTKRNVTEMTRDPVLYIFCVAFPVAMLALFAVINRYSGQNNTVFEFPSLMSGVITFSYSFIMLAQCLLVSKDKTTSLLKRLYTSPMKKTDFVIGYIVPAVIVGIIQTVICLVSGYVISLIIGSDYISFGKCALLALQQLPTLFINVLLGITVGCLLNDKSAPAITSVIISASGILGGAWMPLDVMGGFETFCKFLPFYPSVYLGRTITGAQHTPTDGTISAGIYSFEEWGIVAVVVLAAYLIVCAVSAIVCFGKTMKDSN